MFNSAIGRAEYVASAAQDKFTFVFKIFNEGDVKVYLTPTLQAPDEVNDLLVLGADYLIVINGDNGGDITLLTSADQGDLVTLVRQLPITRPYEYHQDGELDPDTLNADQEYQTYLIAQELEGMVRAVLMPINTQGKVSHTFPAPASDHYIKWSLPDPTTGLIRLENDVNIPTIVQQVIDAEKAMENSVHSNEQHLANVEASINHFQADLLAATAATTAAAAAASQVATTAAAITGDLQAAVAAKDTILQDQQTAINKAAESASSATQSKNSATAATGAAHQVSQDIAGVSADLAAAQTALSATQALDHDVDAKLTAAQAAAVSTSADKTAAENAKDASVASAASAKADKNTAVASKNAAGTSATAAAASQGAAEIAKETATTKASDATNSALEAKHWAIFPHGQQVPEGVAADRSAMHWAIEAKAAATPATHAQIEAGTDNHAEITSLGLSHGVPFLMAKVDTNTGGAGHGDKFVKTKANGKLDPSLMPHGRDNFRGAFKPAAGAEYPAKAGLVTSDFFVIEGLTTSYTIVAGELIGKVVDNRDEYVYDGTNFHLIGKPNFNADSLIPKTAFATQAQTDAGTAADLVVSPKTMKGASQTIMQGFLGSVTSTTGGAAKIPMSKPDGTIDPSYMPLGLGITKTLATALLSVGDMRAFDPYTVYCLPDVTVGGKIVSDTMALFGIPNKYTEMAMMQMRDQNIIMMFGLDGNAPIFGTMVIPETTPDATVMTDATAPRFGMFNLIRTQHLLGDLGDIHAVTAGTTLGKYLSKLHADVAAGAAASGTHHAFPADAEVGSLPVTFDGANFIIIELNNLVQPVTGSIDLADGAEHEVKFIQKGANAIPSAPDWVWVTPPASTNPSERMYSNGKEMTAMVFHAFITSGAVVKIKFENGKYNISDVKIPAGSSTTHKNLRDDGSIDTLSLPFVSLNVSQTANVKVNSLFIDEHQVLKWKNNAGVIKTVNLT